MLMMNTLAATDLLSHVLPHTIFHIGSIPVTNHMIMATGAAVLTLLVFLLVASRVRVSGDGIEAHLTRGRVAQTFEVICIYLRDDMARPALGEITDRYIGYIWTTFFFILFMNLLGLVPWGSFLALLFGEYGYSHIGGTATGNISVTGAMALVSLFMIVFVGIRHAGVGYFKHFCPVEITHPAMILLAVPLVFFEIIGVFIKCLVLAMRLFGNMLAGHLVIAALIGLTFIFNSYLVGLLATVGALAITLLEVFIAFLQAFIFTFLTVLFIAAGAVHEHHDHHTHADDPEVDLGHGVEPVVASDHRPSPTPTPAGA